MPVCVPEHPKVYGPKVYEPQFSNFLLSLECLLCLFQEELELVQPRLLFPENWANGTFLGLSCCSLCGF